MSLLAPHPLSFPIFGSEAGSGKIGSTLLPLFGFSLKSADPLSVTVLCAPSFRRPMPPEVERFSPRIIFFPPSLLWVLFDSTRFRRNACLRLTFPAGNNFGAVVTLSISLLPFLFPSDPCRRLNASPAQSSLGFFDPPPPRRKPTAAVGPSVLLLFCVSLRFFSRALHFGRASETLCPRPYSLTFPFTQFVVTFPSSGL